MRNLKRVSLVSLVSVALLGTMALPASAADEIVPPTVTVTIKNLGLSIETTGAIESAPVIPGATADIPVTGVTVTDRRAGITPWTASVALTPFAGTGLNETLLVPGTYTVGETTPSGGITEMTSIPAVDISTVAAVVQTPAAVSGNNSATWDAILTVTAPAQALADEYTATLTHSVL